MTHEQRLQVKERLMNYAGYTVLAAVAVFVVKVGGAAPWVLGSAIVLAVLVVALVLTRRRS